MKSRFYQPLLPKKKTHDEKMKEFIRKIEQDELQPLKCEIPGKEDGVFRY